MVSAASDASLGETASFLKAPGGAPANVAVGLQRLGVLSGFMGQVGDDPFGHWLRDTVAREGVDVSHLAMSDAARTTIAFVATRHDGKKDICFYRNPGADAQFSLGQIAPQAFDDARLFHCGSVSLSLEPCRSAQFEAARRAREAGALISFDPNWRPSLWNDFGLAHDLIWQMMPLSDVVKVADEEWEFVTGTSNFQEGAAKIRACGPKLVVITRGSDGAIFDFEGGHEAVGGFKAEALDTLGAGDAFVAGLLSQILEFGLENCRDATKMREILRFSNACGAIATQKAGAIPALPTKNEVENFLTTR
ncbi:fructokinase [Abditibacterium utsteinense]|uniref:Fructokinase n=2 Tax=Abditibacterium utsteinense TaxID=1960156 RepID=A0A2S8SXK0_9BACT|nr:fructokinase [Abditibacterium utsteinense]